MKKALRKIWNVDGSTKILEESKAQELLKEKEWKTAPVLDKKKK